MTAADRVVVEADGGSRGNPGPAGYGAVVLSPDGEVLAERAAAIGVATNNVAEYGGLIAGLQAALELGAHEVDVRMDSKLVVEQMAGRWQVKHPSMKPLAAQAAALVRQFDRVSFTWIPRERNARADRLANSALDGVPVHTGGSDAPAPAGAGAAVPAVAAAPAGAGAASPAAARRQEVRGWSDTHGAPPTTTLLLRHGQTALSVDKRFSGVGDQELTEVGQAQAAAAAQRLAGSGLQAVVTSPVRRARQTAQAVADAAGVELVELPGLRETDFGAWEGHTFAEVRERWPDELDAWLRDTAVPPPGGESFDATALRVRQARDEVIRRYPGGTVAVVSHVTPIKTLVRLALEAPPQALYRLHLDLACLSTVQWYSDGPALVRGLNDTHHLGDLPR